MDETAETHEIDPKLARAMERRGFSIPAIGDGMGAQVVKLANFKRLRHVGQKLTAGGALELARGMFLLNLQATQNAMQGIAEVIAANKDDPKVAMVLSKMAIQLLTHHAATAEKLAEAGNAKPSQTNIGVSVVTGSPVPAPPTRPDIGMSSGKPKRLGEVKDHASPVPKVRDLVPVEN